MIVPEIVYSTLTNTCPHCHKGKVFKSSNPYNLLKIFHMNDQCGACGEKYQREPGFFFGAMYVSYALMSGWLIITFLIDLFWLHLPPLTLALGIAGSMVVVTPLFYQWSRLVWLNFFIRYDKTAVLKSAAVNADKMKADF
jgi:uncharacterized protein (DUF983 family)